MINRKIFLSSLIVLPVLVLIVFPANAEVSRDLDLNRDGRYTFDDVREARTIHQMINMMYAGIPSREDGHEATVQPQQPPPQPTVNPTQSPAPEASPTPTPTEPVDQDPIPTDTPQPTGGLGTQGIGNTALGIGNISIPQNSPECQDHDTTQYHSLINVQESCHYDHTHNHDPYKTAFAEIVQGWNQDISYPWQTNNENELKHAGYKYAYFEDLDCNKQLGGDGNCIKRGLIQLHAVGSQIAMVTRYHSFRFVGQVCDTSDNCGMVQTGGISDWGILHCPYKSEHCPLGSDPANVVFGEMVGHPPYRAAPPLSSMDKLLGQGKIIHQWNSGSQPIVNQWYPQSDKYNELLEFDFTTIDAWGAVNPDGPNTIPLVCADGSCHLNHSTLRIYEVVVRMPDGLNSQNGEYNFNGFTDVKGYINSGCTAEGPNCVPLIISSVPGSASFRIPIGNIPSDQFPEYDIYFNGATSGWIKYPN